MKQWIPALFSPCVSMLSGHKKTIAPFNTFVSRVPSAMVVVTGPEPRRRVLRISRARALKNVRTGSRSLCRSSCPPKSVAFRGPLMSEVTGSASIIKKTRQTWRSALPVWWSLQDLNLWPPARQADALPAALNDRIRFYCEMYYILQNRVLST